MRKVVFAVILGAILGAFDGLTAWLEPDIRNSPSPGSRLGTIVMLSSLKSVIAGFLIGISACFIKNRPAIIGFGDRKSVV